MATLRFSIPLLLICALGCGDDDDPVADAGADAASADAGERDGGGIDGSTEDAATADGGGSVLDCVLTGADRSGTESWVDGEHTASVSVMDLEDACARRYTLSTTQPLQDDLPANPRIIVEREGAPTIRTGHDLFDALHALALEEVRENSVDQIEDFAFNDGAPVDCGGAAGCFETGRKWKYVWTRDTAYSVHLGLAAVDPARSRGSLEFKLSDRRGGGSPEIVQDTGTGGSWPISTDRVSWAVGAWELLQHLSGSERDAFRDRALSALSGTLERDRLVAYDPDDGLYRGEQSFLDWREQTYPEWVEGDVVHVGMSKALSTNLLHFRAMEVAAALADETGDSTARDRYAGWATELGQAIRDGFWLEDEGGFSTLITTGLDPAPTRRFDLLGSAFAVLFGVANASQAERIVASYPHYGPGAPVIWPQQQATAIYHNRGEWPFVTAYWLRAAAATGNATVADKMVRALVRGAALNLSNMENFEAGSGDPYVDEGATSGPVVNSQRQLWSVAGYLSMVHHTLFGMAAEPGGLRVAPFVSAELRASLFAGTDTLVLNDYPYRGHRITVVVHLPSEAGSGALPVERWELDGTDHGGSLIAESDLGDDSRLDVFLGTGTGAAGAITEVSDADYRQVFGPRTPRISALGASGTDLVLTLDTNGEDASNVAWRIYRDGVVVADDLAGTTTSWTDTGVDATSERTPCYTAELTFDSGNHSQHAPPVCWWGDSFERITTIDASAMTNVGGAGSSSHGRFHYEPWGDPGDSLTVNAFSPSQSGTHLLQVTFGNGAGGVTTGVTCSAKQVTVIDEGSGATVAEGTLMMPHLGTWDRWEDSNTVPAELEAGRSYRIVIASDPSRANMSVFEHFESYTGGLGGSGGEFNRANIAELKILAR